MTTKTGSAWVQLQRKSASLRRSAEQLAKVFVQLASAKDAGVIRGYATAKREIDSWKDLAPKLQASEDALRAVEREATEEVEGFEERLARVMRDAGLAVYGEESLLIVEGVVHTEIDFKQGTVRVNGRAVEDMSVDGVKASVIGELERVRKLITPPDRFLPLLLKAYEAETLQSGKELGSQVQTSALLWQLAMLKQQAGFRANPVTANFREYPREIFRADLYRLLEANLASTGNKRFRYASGSDTAGAVFMLVPQLGRTAYVGRIWFEHGRN